MLVVHTVYLIKFTIIVLGLGLQQVKNDLSLILIVYN